MTKTINKPANSQSIIYNKKLYKILKFCSHKIQKMDIGENSTERMGKSDDKLVKLKKEIV